MGTVCGTGIVVIMGGEVEGEGGELRSTEPMLVFKLGSPLLVPSRLDRRETLGGGVRDALGCSLWMMMESLRPNTSDPANPDPAAISQKSPLHFVDKYLSLDPAFFQANLYRAGFHEIALFVSYLAKAKGLSSNTYQYE